MCSFGDLYAYVLVLDGENKSVVEKLEGINEYLQTNLKEFTRSRKDL